MELRPGLQVADSVLATFARRYGIVRLALFGSVLRGDFDENSDVDILVEFEPGHTPGLFASPPWSASWRPQSAERSTCGLTTT